MIAPFIMQDNYVNTKFKFSGFQNVRIHMYSPTFVFRILSLRDLININARASICTHNVPYSSTISCVIIIVICNSNAISKLLPIVPVSLTTRVICLYNFIYVICDCVWRVCVISDIFIIHIFLEVLFYYTYMRACIRIHTRALNKIVLYAYVRKVI